METLILRQSLVHVFIEQLLRAREHSRRCGPCATCAEHVTCRREGLVTGSLSALTVPTRGTNSVTLSPDPAPLTPLGYLLCFCV